MISLSFKPQLEQSRDPELTPCAQWRVKHMVWICPAVSHRKWPFSHLVDETAWQILLIFKSWRHFACQNFPGDQMLFSSFNMFSPRKHVFIMINWRTRSKQLAGRISPLTQTHFRAETPVSVERWSSLGLTAQTHKDLSLIYCLSHGKTHYI